MNEPVKEKHKKVKMNFFIVVFFGIGSICYQGYQEQRYMVVQMEFVETSSGSPKLNFKNFEIDPYLDSQQLISSKDEAVNY